MSKSQISKILKYKPAKNSIEIFVELIITDNEAATVENTLKQLGYKNIKIKKLGHWEIDGDKIDEKLIKEIILSGELLNTNKEIPYIRMNNQWYSFSADDGLAETQDFASLQKANYLIRYKDDFVGQSKLAALEKMGVKGIREIKRGVIWGIDVDDKKLEQVLATNIFYNPFSQDCLKIK
jgi:phosphoribosylformylglycinamidine synthase